MATIHRSKSLMHQVFSPVKVRESLGEGKTARLEIHDTNPLHECFIIFLFYYGWAPACLLPSQLRSLLYSYARVSSLLLDFIVIAWSFLHGAGTVFSRNSTRNISRVRPRQTSSFLHIRVDAPEFAAERQSDSHET